MKEDLIISFNEKHKGKPVEVFVYLENLDFEKKTAKVHIKITDEKDREIILIGEK